MVNHIIVTIHYFVTTTLHSEHRPGPLSVSGPRSASVPAAGALLAVAVLVAVPGAVVLLGSFVRRAALGPTTRPPSGGRPFSVMPVDQIRFFYKNTCAMT